VVSHDTVVGIAEESVTVSKRTNEIGRVQVAVTTEVIEQLVRETLLTRHAEIERVSINMEISAAPQIRQEGEFLIVPVVEEVLVVQKRLVLKEEIRLRIVESQEAVELPVQRRAQKVKVERLPPAAEPPSDVPSTPVTGKTPT
jgi:stress response protein YsnF